MSIFTIIRTVGKADVHEEIEFVTRDRLVPGDIVVLKPTKPITDPIYGHAQVTVYLGPGRDQTHRKYRGVRIN